MSNLFNLLRIGLLATLAVLSLLSQGVTRGLASTAAGSQQRAAAVQSLPCKKQVAQGTRVVTKQICLEDIKGNGQTLNDILSIGIVLGAGDFCCFTETKKSFLAPAHFKVKWSVSCQSGAGGGTLAFFYIVGYDGRYQPEELYTAYDAGSKSGTTNLDTTGVKRWAFVASDSDKQACTFRLTAKKVSI
jgi:hypothetical protein